MMIIDIIAVTGTTWVNYQGAGRISVVKQSYQFYQIFS